MGFDFENIARQSEFLDWLQDSQTKFEVVDIEVARHFTGSANSPRSWKDVAPNVASAVTQNPNG
jgi:hypothetical protein